MDDKAITERAILEAKREGVELAYRLVLIRQGEHEKSGRFKEASECAAIRYCLEIAAEGATCQHCDAVGREPCRRPIGYPCLRK